MSKSAYSAGAASAKDYFILGEIIRGGGFYECKVCI